MTKQSTVSINIVQGTPDVNEAKAFADLGNMASGGLFAHMLGAVSAQLMQRMYMQPENEMSHQQTHCAYADGGIAGMCNGYSPAQKQQIISRTNRMMVQYAGWHVARMVWTGIQLRHIFNFVQQLPDDTFYIQILATYPQFRGLGIGRQLLTHAEAQAAAHNCHTLALDVDIANTNAIRVYEYTGFTVADRSPVKTLYGRPLGMQRMVKQVTL